VRGRDGFAAGEHLCIRTARSRNARDHRAEDRRYGRARRARSHTFARRRVAMRLEWRTVVSLQPANSTARAVARNYDGNPSPAPAFATPVRTVAVMASAVSVPACSAT